MINIALYTEGRIGILIRKKQTLSKKKEQTNNIFRQIVLFYNKNNI